MKHIKLFEEYKEEEYVVGNYYKINPYDYDRDEEIWGVFDNMGMYYWEDNKFKCIEIEVEYLYNQIKDSIEFMEDEQREIIDDYKKDVESLLKYPLIVEDGYLLDGNHRTVAFYEAGVEKCMAIDLTYPLK